MHRLENGELCLHAGMVSSSGFDALMDMELYALGAWPTLLHVHYFDLAPRGVLFILMVDVWMMKITCSFMP